MSNGGIAGVANNGYVGVPHWPFSQRITIDHTKIDADLTDFPVKVVLDDNNFDFDLARSDGHDIRFEAGSVLLAYERELFLSFLPEKKEDLSYNRTFNGTTDYDNLVDAQGLLSSPIQTYEIDFTAESVLGEHCLLYVEFAEQVGSTWVDTNLRRFTLSIAEGKLRGYLTTNNRGVQDSSEVVSQSVVTAGKRYTAKIAVNNFTKTIEIFLDGISQGVATVSAALLWGQVNNMIWIDLGVVWYHPHSLGPGYSGNDLNAFFHGTIHSYSFNAKKYAAASYHVKVPHISSTVDTSFDLLYGNPDASDGENKNAVWDDNFAMVNHMGADLTDSAKHGNDGVNGGTVVEEAGGGYSQVFDGIDDYIDIPHHTSLNADSQTIEVYSSIDNADSTKGLICKAPDTGFSRNFWILITKEGIVSASVCDGESKYVILTTATTIFNKPHHLALTKTRGNIKDVIGLFNDGVSEGTGILDGHGAQNPEKVTLGRVSSTSIASGYLKGRLLEVRISNIDRSPAWIKATSETLHNTLLTVHGPRPKMLTVNDVFYRETMRRC